MTYAFYLGAAALLAAAVLICTKPSRRRRQAGGRQEEGAEVLALLQRKEEIDRDRDRGLLDADRADEMKAEIDREIESCRKAEAGEMAEDEGARSLAGRTRIAVAVFVPVVAGIAYLQVGEPELAFTTPETQRQAAVSRASPELDLPAAVEKLSEHIERDPGDDRARELLYRSLMTLRRYGEAADAARGLIEARGEGADELVMLAEAVALADGGGLEGEALEHVERAIEIDPGHVLALWLYAAAAEARGEHELAAETFERMAAIAGEPAQSERFMRFAYESRSQASGGGGAAASGELRLNVMIDPELSAQAGPGDALFVFAREIGGPPAPVAAVRMEAAALPAQVTLSDAQAMVAGRKLSSFREVEVVARVSPSGSPAATSGDLQGSIAAAKVGAGGELTLTIDGTVP